MDAKVHIPHVTMQGAVYLYERRVPKRFVSVANQKRVRKSLRTKDSAEAKQRAAEVDACYEARWQAQKSLDEQASFAAAVELVQQSGFQWRAAQQLLTFPEQLVMRANALS
ncbi:MAG: DUF6538 domain-containing protein, partial [Pseudomonadota bacterium]